MSLLSLNYVKGACKYVCPFLGGIALCLLHPGLSRAAEWSMRGNVYQMLGYDDNVQMLSSSPQGSFQYKILPTLNFIHRTDATEVRAHASYGTQIYTDIPQFDRDIQNYGVNGAYKTERINWGLDFNYSITPSRNTAIQDSGDFTDNTDKTTWRISPMMTYKLSLIDSLVLSPSFSESSFGSVSGNTAPGSPTNFTFQDNSTRSVNLGWQRMWTERYSSNFGFFYSNFEFGSSGSNNNGFSRTNDSFGVNFSHNYRWSDTWNLTGSVGARHSISSSGQSTPELTSTGFLANLGATYSAENYKAGLTFSRSLIPSNYGQLQEVTGTNLFFKYKVDERLSVGVDMSYQDSSSVNALNNSVQRENIVVHPSLNWLITRDWTLNASYRYRTQDRTFSNQAATTADSNFFMLSVNYNWPGIKLSR